jgi:hypothetical protein
MQLSDESFDFLLHPMSMTRLKPNMLPSTNKTEFEVEFLSINGVPQTRRYFLVDEQSARALVENKESGLAGTFIKATVVATDGSLLVDRKGFYPAQCPAFLNLNS